MIALCICLAAGSLLVLWAAHRLWKNQQAFNAEQVKLWKNQTEINNIMAMRFFEVERWKNSEELNRSLGRWGRL